MTNFEKIVQGGPDALLKLLFIHCRDCLARPRDSECDSPRAGDSCKRKLLAWLKQPAKLELSADEKALLRAAILMGLEWAVRDESGLLGFYPIKPERGKYGEWRYAGPHWINYTGPLPLNFIQWSNNEPWSLAELLEGAE